MTLAAFIFSDFFFQIDFLLSDFSGPGLKWSVIWGCPIDSLSPNRSANHRRRSSHDSLIMLSEFFKVLLLALQVTAIQNRNILS